MTNAHDAVPSKRFAAVLLLLAAVAALGLQRETITRQSLIGDAPYHLLAGYQALAYGTNSLNLEHPPLAKLIMAQPLLEKPPNAWRLPVSADRVSRTTKHLFDDPAVVEHVRQRGRTRLLWLIAVPLLVTCALLGGTLAGWPGAAALFMAVGLSFATIPLLTVMQTDAAVALGYTLVALGGIRFVRRPSAAHAVLLGVGVGIALASKFSGVLTVPAAAWALIVAADLPWQRRLARGALAAVVAGLVVGSVFAIANHRYDPPVGEEGIRLFARSRAVYGVGDRLHAWEPHLIRLSRTSPGLAQWLTGILGVRAHDREAMYTSYALGDLYSHGRWWYFPLVLLIKMPLAAWLTTLLAAFAGWTTWRRRGPPRDARDAGATSWRQTVRRPGVLLTLLLVPYLSQAMLSNFNLGLRHLLPVVPLMLVPAALWVARRRGRLVVFGVVLLLESLALTPVWMSATNTWWLGDANPSRFALGNANLDAHQNLVALREVAERRGLAPLTVMHPWIDAAELHASFPTARWLAPSEPPRPGWHAVVVTLDQYIPALDHGGDRADFHLEPAYRRLMARWTPAWRAMACADDHGYAAGSFHLFELRPEQLDDCAATTTTPNQR